MHFTVVVKALSYSTCWKFRAYHPEQLMLGCVCVCLSPRVCAVCSPFSQLLLLNDFRISSLGSLLETMNLVGGF